MDTQNLGELFAALAAARLEFSPIVKNKTANTGTYSYDYADLKAVIDATAPALARHGLNIIQDPELITENGQTTVVVSGCIGHKSGAVYPLKPLALPVAAKTAQAVGSALSYARRYQLSAVLGVAAADDDDDAVEADAATPQKAAQRALTPVKVQAQPPTSKPRATVDQVARLDVLGIEYYGEKKWPEERTRLAGIASKGAVQQPTELMESEIAKLIKGLTDEIAKAERLAEVHVATAKPVAH